MITPLQANLLVCPLLQTFSPISTDCDRKGKSSRILNSYLIPKSRYHTIEEKEIDKSEWSLKKRWGLRQEQPHGKESGRKMPEVLLLVEQNPRAFQKCIWEDFDTADVSFSWHSEHWSKALRNLDGGVAQDRFWGPSQQGVCLNSPLLSIRANDDTRRLWLPSLKGWAMPTLPMWPPSNIHQNLSEMGVLMPCLCHLQTVVNWTSTGQAKFQYSGLGTLS